MKLSEKLYSRARENFQTGNLDEALKDIEESVQMLRKTTILIRRREGPDFERFVDAKILQGRIYAAMGDQEQVDETVKYLKTLTVGADEDTNHLQGKINYFLYDLLRQTDSDTANSYLEKAKDNFAVAGDYDDAIEILFDLERTEKYRNDPDGLMDLYKEILDLNKKISDKDLKKSNSGRARFQIARVLGRSDLKKSRKEVIKAYEELIDNPVLQIDSLVYLAMLDIYDSPGKVRKVLSKVDTMSYREYDQLRLLLIKVMLAVIEENSNGQQLYNEIQNLIPKVEVDTKLSDLVLEVSRFIAIYGQREKHQQIREVLKLAIDGFDQTDDKQGKVIAYIIDGLLAIDQQDRENRMKLVDVYSKSIKDTVSPYLRTQSLDMINWIGESYGESKLVDDIKAYYNYDKVKQAETTKLLAMYYGAKHNGNSEKLYEEAKDLFKKSKFYNSSSAIDLIENELSQIT